MRLRMTGWAGHFAIHSPQMPCDHKGAPELIDMAEAHLRDVDVAQWPGLKFRWSENLDGGMWASVVVEIERRGEQWIVTRLDRNKDAVAETGFRQI
jgi:hypothetical protein